MDGTVTISLEDYESLTNKIKCLEDIRKDILDEYDKTYTPLFEAFIKPVIDVYKLGENGDDLIKDILSKIHFDTTVQMSENKTLLFWSSHVDNSKLKKINGENNMIKYTNHLEEEKEDDYIYVFEGNVWLGGRIIQCEYRTHMRAKNENEAWWLLAQKYCDETKLKIDPFFQGKLRKKRYFDGNLR